MSENIRLIFDKYYNKKHYPAFQEDKRKLLEKGLVVSGDIQQSAVQGGNTLCEENAYKYAKSHKGSKIVIGEAEHDGDWGNHWWILTPEGEHLEVTKGWRGSKGRIGFVVKREHLKRSLSKWCDIPDSKLYEKHEKLPKSVRYV